MAIVLGRDMIIRALASYASIIRSAQAQVRSLYRNADKRMADGDAPGDVQNEMQLTLSEIEDIVKAVAVDITALNFQFQTYASGKLDPIEIQAEGFRSMASATHPKDVGIIQPANKAITWYDGVTEPFVAGDKVRVESAADSANDGLYEVVYAASETVDGAGMVSNGRFLYGDGGAPEGADDWEVAAPGTWANWTWASGGITHVPGTTHAVQQLHADFATTPTNASVYIVEFTVSGATAGNVAVDMDSNWTIYTTEDGAAANGTHRFSSTYSAAQLRFTPTTDFDGTISDVQMHPLRGVVLASALSVDNDSDARVRVELADR